MELNYLWYFMQQTFTNLYRIWWREMILFPERRQPGMSHISNARVSSDYKWLLLDFISLHYLPTGSPVTICWGGTMTFTLQVLGRQTQTHFIYRDGMGNKQMKDSSSVWCFKHQLTQTSISRSHLEAANTIFDEEKRLRFFLGCIHAVHCPNKSQCRTG